MTHLIDYLGMRNFTIIKPSGIHQLEEVSLWVGYGELPLTRSLLRPDQEILNGGATAAFIESLASWTSYQTIKLASDQVNNVVGVDLNVQHLRPLFWKEGTLLTGKASFIHYGKTLHTLSVDIHALSLEGCEKKIAFGKMIMMVLPIKNTDS